MTSAKDRGLFIIRLMLGVVFLYHGSQKLFGAFGGPGIDGFAGFLASLNVPMPTLSAWLAALAEFGGGLALVTGIMFRLAMLPLIFTMFVAALTVHAKNGFSIQNGGLEYPLTLAVILIGLVLTGPGDVGCCMASAGCGGGGCGGGGCASDGEKKGGSCC